MFKNILISFVLITGLSGIVSAGAPPTASTPEINPIPDGKGFVQIGTNIFDPDQDGCRLKVEYSTDSLAGPWYKAWIDENNIYDDHSPFPDVNNSLDYQIGSSLPVITQYGADKVIFRWDTKNENNEFPDISTGDISTVRLRVTPNDGTYDGGSAPSVQDFEVDNQPPVPPGLAYGGFKTESLIRLLFNASGSDTNFKEYRIYYSTNASVTENDMSWTDPQLDLGNENISNLTTNIGPLKPETSYYFNIWIYDTSGNKAKANELGPVLTLSGPVARDLSGAHAYPVPFNPSLGHNSIIFAGVPTGSVIKIYTISGKIIKTLENTSASSAVTWDTVADDGYKAASGTYIYSIQKDSSVKKGKLVIMR